MLRNSSFRKILKIVNTLSVKDKRPIIREKKREKNPLTRIEDDGSTGVSQTLSLFIRWNDMNEETWFFCKKTNSSLRDDSKGHVDLA